MFIQAILIMVVLFSSVRNCFTHQLRYFYIGFLANSLLLMNIYAALTCENKWLSIIWGVTFVIGYLVTKRYNNTIRVKPGTKSYSVIIKGNYILLAYVIFFVLISIGIYLSLYHSDSHVVNEQVQRLLNGFNTAMFFLLGMYCCRSYYYYSEGKKLYQRKPKNMIRACSLFTLAFILFYAFYLLLTNYLLAHSFTQLSEEAHGFIKLSVPILLALHSIEAILGPVYSEKT